MFESHGIGAGQGKSQMKMLTLDRYFQAASTMFVRVLGLDSR